MDVDSDGGAGNVDVDEEMWTRGMAMWIAMEVQEMWMWMRRCGRGAWRCG